MGHPLNNIQLIFGMFSECYTHGGAHPYARCNFPFKYKGKSFDTCTYFNSFDENKAWCSTKKDKNDNHIFESGHWGYCKENSSCPLPGRQVLSSDESEHTFWQAKPRQAF